MTAAGDDDHNDDDDDDGEDDDGDEWSVSEPAGEWRTITIDTTETTWSNVDISPDGTTIVFDMLGDLYTVPIEGGEATALTDGIEWSFQPRFSPDGKYLAFLSARDEGKTQIWTLFREGGEGVQLTDTAQDVSSFEWAPDSKRLVLVLKDPKPEELEAHEKGDEYEEKTPPPWVVTRQQFKMDYVGYLDSRRDHLYVFENNGITDFHFAHRGVDFRVIGGASRSMVETTAKAIYRQAVETLK